MTVDRECDSPKGGLKYISYDVTVSEGVTVFQKVSV